MCQHKSKNPLNHFKKNESKFFSFIDKVLFSNHLLLILESSTKKEEGENPLLGPTSNNEQSRIRVFGH